jgi:hypothetical protein
VASGEVSLRKAEVVLERTAPRDDAFWTARARTETVRGLLAATQAGAVGDEDAFHTLLLSIPAQQQEVVWTALDWARLVEGGATRRMRQVEAISCEYLGSFPIPLQEDASLGAFPGMAPAPPQAVETSEADDAWAGPGEDADESEDANDYEDADEHEGAGGSQGPDESEGAEESEREAGVPEALPGDDWPFDAHAVLARLKALVQERALIDERLRRACFLVKELKAYRWLGFTRFDAWCTEALGLNLTTIRHLVALEKHLQALPPLRQAVRDGTLTLEQARHVARNATLADVGHRIAQAAGLPALDTQRQAEAEEERRLRERGMMKLALSGRTHRLLLDALASAKHRGHGDTLGEALQCICAHFLLTWREEVKRGLRKAGPAMRRDDFRCQVPGCSRGAQHLHHIIWRCRGGRNHQRNLLALCALHHQRGVHQGQLVISGEAPDNVIIEFIGKEVMVRGWREPPARAVA